MPLPLHRKAPGGHHVKLPDAFCPACGRLYPKVSRQPIYADGQLAWDDMIYIERRLIAGLMLDHVRGNEYRVWGPKLAAMLSNMRYRQVHNALRRLVICGWVTRVSRGLYRLSELTVASVQPMITNPRMTLTKLQAAQATPTGAL